MLAGQQRGLGVREVQVVGRGQVHHVDRRVGQHGFIGGIAASMPSSAAFFSASFAVALRQPDHVDVVAPQAFQVGRADEAGPGNAHAELLFGC